MSIGEVLATLRVGVPGRHDLQDPLPGVGGSGRAGAHALRLPQVLPRRRRPAALRPVRPARQLPAAAGHQVPPRGDRPRARAAGRGRWRPAGAPGAGRRRRAARAGGLRPRGDRAAAVARGARRRGRDPTRAAGRAGAVRARRRPPGRLLRRGRPGHRQDGGRDGRFGLEPRHLRAFRAAADREVGLVEQVVAPLVRQRNPRPAGEPRRSPASWPRCRSSCTRCSSSRVCGHCSGSSTTGPKRRPRPRQPV